MSLSDMTLTELQILDAVLGAAARCLARRENAHAKELEKRDAELAARDARIAELSAEVARLMEAKGPTDAKEA